MSMNLTKKKKRIKNKSFTVFHHESQGLNRGQLYSVHRA